MAEVVSCLQERTIPEYELMRKHKVFSDEKIRGIVKTRENYQYKLSKNAKSLKDYGEYIIYEKKIHGMVTAIEASRKEKFPGLKAAMSNRIVRLYKEALRGFPEESRLWEAYLKFCKNNFAVEVPNAYEKLLQKMASLTTHPQIKKSIRSRYNCELCHLCFQYSRITSTLSSSPSTSMRPMRRGNILHLATKSKKIKK